MRNVSRDAKLHARVIPQSYLKREKKYGEISSYGNSQRRQSDNETSKMIGIICMIVCDMDEKYNKKKKKGKTNV